LVFDPSPSNGTLQGWLEASKDSAGWAFSAYVACQTARPRVNGALKA
jgi:hypothetical protein